MIVTSRFSLSSGGDNESINYEHLWPHRRPESKWFSTSWKRIKRARFFAQPVEKKLLLCVVFCAQNCAPFMFPFVCTNELLQMGQHAMQQKRAQEETATTNDQMMFVGICLLYFILLFFNFFLSRSLRSPKTIKCP